jgi:hypothetical protein
MLTTTCFGRCRPSSGHRIVSQREAIQVTSISYRYKFIVSKEISLFFKIIHMELQLFICAVEEVLGGMHVELMEVSSARLVLDLSSCA